MSDKKIAQQLDHLCAEGDALVAQGKLDEGLSKYFEGEDLAKGLENPNDALAWIALAIGETYFFAGEWQAAQEHLTAAAKHPHGADNPIIQLRLGQIAFEQGDQARALQLLGNAFEGIGDAIFEGEDPKYVDFLIDGIEKQK